MRMSPINQPLMLMELLGHGFAGQQPARPSAEHRPADAGKRMVGRVLNGNGITRYGDRLYTLIPPLPGKMTPLHPDHFHHQGA
jgi:hypothetical protein